MDKQLLILEDIGIPKQHFKHLLGQRQLPYQLVWEVEEADKEAVEVLVTVKKKVDRQTITQFPNLKLIAVAFTGYDSVDLETCRQKGIAVYNVPAYATKAVVELTLGLTLGLLREIPFAHNAVINKKWVTQPGNDLSGKTIGIIGTGKIGLNTAQVFKAFGCNLVAWSRTQKEEFTNLGGQYVDELTELCAQSDIISVHLLLNHKTKGIVGEKELEAMKNTAFLVNTARGPIVDETALYAVLKAKKIAGAGLDVFGEEPLPDDHPFRDLDNVILTPHIAYKTEEALVRRAEVTLNNIQNFLKEDNTNRVDL